MVENSLKHTIKGPLQTATNQEALEFCLGGSSPFIALDRAFNDSSRKSENGKLEVLTVASDKTANLILKNIYTYILSSEKRREILRHTPLRGSDDFTLTVLAALLAYRQGFSITVVRPRRFLPSFFYRSSDVALAYEGRERFFLDSLNGGIRYTRYRTLSNGDIIKHLRLHQSS